MENNSKQRILIVDDTPENIHILSESLKGFVKYIALNGEKAIKLATEKIPDLILLDIIMPGMNGFEVCEKLKSDDRTKEIPIIFLSSESHSDSIVRGFEAGAADYVTKPFNAKELTTRVKTQIELKISRTINKNYLKEIENKNKLILDSIQYAKLIQQAILPSVDAIENYVSDSFILYLPKDIVSGDFYWARKIDNKLILVEADSTGHGVPGAFMSMLGMAFLNEIIGKDLLTTPAFILNKLRTKVIESLNQGKSNILRDGIDMAILCIDLNTLEAEFAGANSPMYLVRNNELKKIKCNRMPVAISDRMDSFEDIKIQLVKGDKIYMFSDGYTDQFGGPKHKKFKHKAFRQLILENCNKNMAEQKTVYHEAIKAWRGTNEQVDDILVLGVKI
jgi:CheY-like chemotaxis protein